MSAFQNDSFQTDAFQTNLLYQVVLTGLSTINTTISNAFIYLKEITSSSTVSTSIIKAINLIKSINTNTVVSIQRTVVIIQLITSITTAVLIKQIGKLLTTSVSNIVTIVNRVRKQLKPTVYNTASLTYGRFFFKTLTSTVINLFTIRKDLVKLFIIAVQSNVVISKFIRLTITLPVTIIFNLLTSVYTIFGSGFSSTIYAQVKQRLLQRISIRDIFAQKD